MRCCCWSVSVAKLVCKSYAVAVEECANKQLQVNLNIQTHFCSRSFLSPLHPEAYQAATQACRALLALQLLCGSGPMARWIGLCCTL